MIENCHKFIITIFIYYIIWQILIQSWLEPSQNASIETILKYPWSESQITHFIPITWMSPLNQPSVWNWRGIQFVWRLSTTYCTMWALWECLLVDRHSLSMRYYTMVSAIHVHDFNNNYDSEDWNLINTMCDHIIRQCVLHWILN